MGGAKPKGVVTSCYITIHADVAVGEKGTHTQLLNGIGPFLCNFVAIPRLTNAKKVAHHRIVFHHDDVCGPHRGVAPLLRIGQLRTSPKSAVVTLDTLITQVESTISKGREEDLCPGGGEELSSLDRGKKAFRFDMAATPASARRADTGPKRVQSPFGRKTVSTSIPCALM